VPQPGFELDGGRGNAAVSGCRAYRQNADGGLQPATSKLM